MTISFILKIQEESEVNYFERPVENIWFNSPQKLRFDTFHCEQERLIELLISSEDAENLVAICQ